jgi:uncharacterized protein YdeI (YjbR/CyaY-like superfamily)
LKPGKTLYVTTRKDWRAWLARNHAREKEIWLVAYRKGSGKRRLAYNAAVEEALCYGWIDSVLRRIDDESFAQRYSPRRPGSKWSAMNRERLRRLIEQGKVTKAGMAAAEGAVPARGGIAPDILKRLQRDPATWKNFQRFPASYKRIRIGWIEGSRNRPEVFEQRLRYFLKMTAQNKRYGMVQ